MRLADALIVNKVDSASGEQVAQVLENISRVNPEAEMIQANSVIKVDQPELIRGKRVLIVGDGPTLTHGGMSQGAGTIAAQRFGAREIADGRRYAVGSIKAAYEQYSHLGAEIPAVGYSPQQVRDLEATINRAGAEVVIDATPVELPGLIRVEMPVVEVEYDLEEVGDGLILLLSNFEERPLVILWCWASIFPFVYFPTYY